MLEPVDGCERAGEENAFYGSKGNESFSEGLGLGVAPMQCPFGFALDAGDGLDGVVEKSLVGVVLDQRVDKQAVCFVVDGLFESCRNSGLPAV